MCTVTFIPSSDKVVITSNRDEHVSRKARLRPIEQTINGLQVVYPKDRTVGGTWFALNENGTIIVLLNGAFQNHKRTPPYRRSRGLLVLDVISTENPLAVVQDIDLFNIEPFTLVLFDKSRLWEFRWDGRQKHVKQLDAAQSHIWSSWTLYDDEAQNLRNQYFENFVAEDGYSGTQQILDFHRENHGDWENGFIIDRLNGLKTLSVTQVVTKKNVCELRHFDLEADKEETVMLHKPSSLISGL